jgi:hypothetical protein
MNTPFVVIAIAVWLVIVHFVANLMIALTSHEPYRPYLSMARKREILEQHVAMVHAGGFTSLEAALKSFERTCGTGHHSRCHNVFAPFGPFWEEPIDRIFDAWYRYEDRTRPLFGKQFYN